MSFKNAMNKSTAGSCSAIEALGQALERADAIVVGAGSGLSSSAGLTYSGPRFEALFADFIAKYHFKDMYTAGFYPYASPEEYWAYWSRYIYHNRYDLTPGRVYFDLLKLVKDRDYFVITTNVDHQFQLTGFDKARLFYTQGDYGLWQCSLPCHKRTYDNEKTVRRMVAEQRERCIPTGLIPLCPRCGRPMTMNLRSDETFVEDEGWHRAQRRYEDFLKRHEGLSILYLELGVGSNTPVIIKYPFWLWTAQNPKATYACINLTDATAPQEILPQSIRIEGDIGEAIASLIP